jgi:uncharacterized protein with GYD domain
VEVVSGFARGGSNRLQREGSSMGYHSASKLTFTPKWADMSADERLTEQAAAYELVSKFGGDIKAMYILWSDGCLLSVVEYPDETSAVKSASAIANRGAFVLASQRAFPLDEFQAIQDEIAGL